MSKRIREVIIELTSLLDVVMILIFGVLIQNSKMVEETRHQLSVANEQNLILQAEVEEMSEISEELTIALEKLDEGEIDELLNQIKQDEVRIDSYEYLNDIVIVYNINLQNQYNNHIRSLTYGPASSDSLVSNTFRREDTEEWKACVNTMKLSLNDFIKHKLEANIDDTCIYIVFSINSSNVFNSDYQDVDSAIKSVTSFYMDEQVYYRINYLQE